MPFLSFYLNEKGKRVYTLKKRIENGDSDVPVVTFSAHPARFSPDDKYSKQRLTIKKRFGVLPTQLPPSIY